MILTNREIRVRLDNHISQPTKVKNGIAQGAKSSTTLADIYTSAIGGKETETKSKGSFKNYVTLGVGRSVHKFVT